jgi:hypothetical protein
MGIESFIPKEEDLESCEVIEGVIICAHPYTTNPVSVQLDGYEDRSEIPRYCFACSSDDLDGVRGGRKIKYYKWETKTGRTGEIVEVLPEPKNISPYEDGDTEINTSKDEIDQMVDEAIDQLDELREE